MWSFFSKYLVRFHLVVDFFPDTSCRCSLPCSTAFPFLHSCARRKNGRVGKVLVSFRKSLKRHSAHKFCTGRRKVKRRRNTFIMTHLSRYSVGFLKDSKLRGKSVIQSASPSVRRVVTQSASDTRKNGRRRADRQAVTQSFASGSRANRSNIRANSSKLIERLATYNRKMRTRQSNDIAGTRTGCLSWYGV